MFAYDELFGAKGKSDADLKNEAAGKETTIDRTRRLFYCAKAVEAAKTAMTELGWFAEDEIEVVTWRDADRRAARGIRVVVAWHAMSEQSDGMATKGR